MITGRRLFNNLNFSIIIFDENLLLNFINLPAQEYTGYSERYVGNIHAPDFFQNNDYIHEKIKDVARTGEGFIDFECEFLNRKEEKRFVLLEINKVPDENSFYIVLTMKDVTRFREMDNNVKNEEKLKDLSRFVAEMAHEIRNPLGGVRAAASYISKKLPGENLKSFIDIILKETSRINNLMEELLSLSRKHRIKSEKVNANKIINEAILLEESGLKNGNITFIKEFDPSLPKITGSPDALKQVFINALRNAVEAIPGGRAGEVRVVTKIDHTRNNPRYIEIDFIDSGRGIKKADMEKLFAPFFTTKEKGSGLGLAISRKIIYDHNGLIEINPSKARGTTLSIFLPVNRA